MGKYILTYFIRCNAYASAYQWNSTSFTRIKQSVHQMHMPPGTRESYHSLWVFSCYSRTKKINTSNEYITKPPDYRVKMTQYEAEVLHIFLLLASSWLKQILPPLPSQKVQCCPYFTSSVLPAKLFWSNKVIQYGLKVFVFVFPPQNYSV